MSCCLRDGADLQRCSIQRSSLRSTKSSSRALHSRLKNHGPPAKWWFRASPAEDIGSGLLRHCPQSGPTRCMWSAVQLRSSRPRAYSSLFRHAMPCPPATRIVNLPPSAGCWSYGPSQSQERTAVAAGYAARIVSGEKAADLPFELPTKSELVDQSRTAAKLLGLTVPPTLLAPPTR